MASAAALFDRQQLKSREDMLVLGQLLNDVMQEYIEKEGARHGPESIERMEASTVEVFRQVKQFVGYDENGSQGDEEGLKSPHFAPLSPPPYDPEVARLEKEVEKASERISKLRVDMQKAIEEKVQKNILEKLPQVEDDTEVEGTEETEPGVSGVDASELKRKLADAASKMPGLRAKLEDVYEKMYKIIDSMDEGIPAGDNAPNTAERALKRLYDEPQNLDVTGELPSNK